MNNTHKSNTNSNTKRKKTRFFEIYISKIIRNISDNCGITSNAKQQFNSVLCIIAKIISDKTFSLLEISNKKTISEKEVFNSLIIILSDQICKNANIHGQKAIDKFTENKKNKLKILSRQEKYGIIFPPYILEKFLRNFGYSNAMISHKAPIYLAGALEYIAFEILENSYLQAKDKKHIRITIRDLELGIRNDNELNKFFNKNKISFLGGGIVPYIHNSLTIKKQVNKITQNKIKNSSIINRKICNKKLQNSSNCLILSKSSFEKFVRKIVQENTNIKIKISKDLFIVIQYFVEQKISQILQKSNFACIHAGRVKLLPTDIKFIISLIEENCNPYKNMDKKCILDIKNIKNYSVNIDNDDDINDDDINDDDINDDDINDDDIDDDDINDDDINDDDIDDDDIDDDDDDIDDDDNINLKRI